MLVKFISLVSLICAVAISSVNLKDASDPLFFIVSGGLGPDLSRIALSAFMVLLAFFALPKKAHLVRSLLLTGTALIGIGITGVVISSVNYALYDYIKPLDFLMIIETGIVSNLVALEAHKPMFHFSDPYRKAFTIAFLPHLRNIKSAAA